MQSDVFTEYVRRYSAMVYRIAYSYTRSRPDSEDIMQDVLLKLYQYGKSFRDEQHVKAWLIRVAVNRSKDMLRSSQKRQAQEPYADTPTDAAVSDAPLDEAMAALSEEYRLVVYLFYFEGYSVKEISRILRITESNVKIRLKRAREKLKNLLTEE